MERGTFVSTLVVSAIALALSACGGVEADELGGAAIRPAAGIKAKAAHVAPGSDKSFNPQPEPPARLKDAVSNPVTEKGFNPQPEPPAKGGGVINPGDAKGFNPQPEPPGQPTINPADGAAR